MSRWRKAAPGVPVTPVRRVESLVMLGAVAALLGVNHLSVVCGFGVSAEAMVTAAALLPIGLVWAAYPRSFQAVERRLQGSRRMVALAVVAGLLLGVVGIVLAELLARWWYGERLFW